MMTHGGDRKSKNISLSKSIATSIKFSKQMIDELDARSAKVGVTRSQYIRNVLQREFDRVKI